MSTISRRDFMKTAGVMTLAVAVSAALAGCSTDGSTTTDPITKVTLTDVQKETLAANNTANASNKSHGTETVTFGAYNHEVTANSTIIDYYVVGRTDIYLSAVVTTMEIAAGGEMTGMNDLGKVYYGSGNGQKSEVEMTVAGHNVEGSDIPAEEDLVVYLDPQGNTNDDAENQYRKEVHDRLVALDNGQFKSLTTLAQQNINQHGEIDKTVVVLTRAQSNAAAKGTNSSLVGTFTNENYMKCGSEIGWNFVVFHKTETISLD